MTTLLNVATPALDNVVVVPDNVPPGQVSGAIASDTCRCWAEAVTMSSNVSRIATLIGGVIVPPEVVFVGCTVKAR